MNDSFNNYSNPSLYGYPIGGMGVCLRHSFDCTGRCCALECGICDRMKCRYLIAKCEMCKISVCDEKVCFRKHFYKCVNDKSVEHEKQIEEIRDDINEIKDAINKINERLADLMYAPSGEMYQEAKKDFESKII